MQTSMENERQMIKSILITNHFLRDFTGSEIATLDLAKEFLSRGYDVTVGSFTFADPLKYEFDLLNVKIIDLSSAKADHFDLIWAHHFTTIDTCLIDIGITADKIIFSSLSPYEALECPPLSIDKVHLVLANSFETKEVLIEMGIESSSIEIFPNPVSDAFFTDFAKDKFSLTKLAIVSNHIPGEVKDTVSLLKNHGIEVKIFGIEGEFKLITPDVLKEFDAVITIGRTVQYCLAMGIPVYCYDRFGGPGWITSQNIENAAKHNFSGRCTNRKIQAGEMLNELRKYYALIGAELSFYKQYAIENFRLSSLVQNILKGFENKKNLLCSVQLLKNMAIRQRKHYLKPIENEFFIQLFPDQGNGFTEENSLKLPVAQNTELQEFVFDLSDKQPLHALRLDPLNDSCVIEVEELKIIRADGLEFDLTSYINANACSHHGKSYFFDFHDPQVCFHGISADELSDVKSLVIKIRFAHIGKDALHACISQVISDKNYVIVLREQELDQTRSELDRTQTEFDRTRSEIEQSRMDLEKMRSDLEQTKSELNSVYSSKSWKITQALRTIRQFL